MLLLPATSPYSELQLCLYAPLILLMNNKHLADGLVFLWFPYFPLQDIKALCDCLIMESVYSLIFCSLLFQIKECNVSFSPLKFPCCIVLNMNLTHCAIATLMSHLQRSHSNKCTMYSLFFFSKLKKVKEPKRTNQCEMLFGTQVPRNI